MRLYDEIFKNANGGGFSRCVVTPCGGGYFEGVKSLEDFSAERIVICFAKHRVEAVGNGLSIKKYCDGDLQVHGVIRAVRVLADGE